MFAVPASSPPPTAPADAPDPAVFWVLGGVGVLVIVVSVIALYSSMAFFPRAPDARDRDWPT